MNAKPIIIFDDDNDLIKFEGIFIALSSWDNKGGIFAQVQDYLNNRNQITVECSLIYVDSVSRKLFYEIFNTLKSAINNDHKKIDIYWNYDPEDETILELGKVMHGVIKQPFNFVEVLD